MTDSAGELTEKVVTLGVEPTLAQAVFPLVYEELRRAARRALSNENPGHTLDTTALVHEAYLRLVDSSRVPWQDRNRFLAVAATAMRHILIDHARRRHAVKRGQAPVPVDLENLPASADECAETIIALDDALTRLATLSPRLVQVVECRFFIGMTEEETAAALGVTSRTVRRDWLKAKAWLAAVMSGNTPE